MAKISMKLIQAVREQTGLGMMDCKKALEEANEDVEKAVDLLRKKGAAIARTRLGRKMAEGIVQSYIHPGNRVGVLIEINCETDFVAQTEQFKQFARDICMHIAASHPFYLTPDDVDPKLLEREKRLFKEQVIDSGKPEKIIDTIISGKVNKLYTEICLMKQSFVKNDQKTISDILQELIAKTGENITIKRFARFEIGE